MREIVDIYRDFCNWYAEKVKDESYRYDNIIQNNNIDEVHARLYKQILELCYEPRYGMYYFIKFIIGDLMELGFPKPLRYNKLMDAWWNIARRDKRVCLLSARGHGKAQSLDSKVMTPTGWKYIKELEVGNEVIGSNGKSTKIIQLHPIEKMDLYEVTTRDGRKTLCNDEHLWTVLSYNEHRPTIVTKSLKDMISNYKITRFDKRTNKHYIEYKYFLENSKPIEYEEKHLLIEPYTLGAWLGDGHSYSGGFTTADIEIFKYIPHEIRKNKGKYAYYIQKLKPKLRSLNLLQNKHIPEEYLYGSIEQRTELLQGLIDTDGYIQPGGKRFDFSNTNKVLMKQVIDLVRSLGGTATLQDRKNMCNGKICYSQNITCRVPDEIIPCRLSRKVNVWKKSIKTRNAIVNIEYVKNDLARCITVENKDGLYITDDYMLTHNSVYFSELYNIYYMFLFSFRRVILISSSAEQAEHILQEIKIIIDNNEWLSKKKLNGTWATEKIDYNKGYILAKGIGSEILGQHVDRIIIDDILRTDNKLTDKEIEDYIDMNLEPMTLNRSGQIILVGTSKRATDIFGTILARIKAEPKSSWKYYKFPAILDYENKILQCPDRFTWEEIMEKRLSMGPLKFAREYQLEFFSRDTSLFPRDMVDLSKVKGKEFSLMDKADKRGGEWTFVAGLDTARSGAVSADFTVCFVLAYNNITQTKQIVYFWRGKGLKIREQAEKVAHITRRFNNCYILVEKNNLGQDMIDELVDVWNVNVGEYITGGKGQKKEELVRFLINSFEYEQIIIPQGDDYSREQMDILEDELSKYCVLVTPMGNETFGAISGHDDAVMALALANKGTQTVGIPFAANLSSKDVLFEGLNLASRDETDLVTKIRLGLIK